jgi:cell wall-associated NlpC family hydrolase
MASALVAGAGIGFGSVTAGADPSPPSRASDLAHYKELTTKTEKVQEAYLKAQYDLKQKRAELDAATAKLAAARKHERQAEQKVHAERARIDKLSAASLEGAGLAKLSTVLGGQSAQDFVQRKEAVQWLATSNKHMLGEVRRAETRAEHANAHATTATHQAEHAKTSAKKLRDSLAKRKKALKHKIARVQQALDTLPAPARKKLSAPGDEGKYVPAHTSGQHAGSSGEHQGSAGQDAGPSGEHQGSAGQDAGSSGKDAFVGPPGAAGKVIKAALAKRGDPYRWGADGPSAFDCSGLVQYAYSKAGISLPHSSAAQYQHGTPVARGDWKPGDLLFYGSSPSSIHHVAIYVGNGKVVHAPTAGEPVKVVPAPNGAGSNYYGAKRIVH